MDLGTANTIIISDDKIVVDEPSVVALDRRTDKMIAVGQQAKMMYEKTHDNIRTIRPLRDGVIADFSACEQMMRGLIKMVHTGRHIFSPSLRMVIGVPSGSTEVELRAVRDSAMNELLRRYPQCEPVKDKVTMYYNALFAKKMIAVNNVVVGWQKTAR